MIRHANASWADVRPRVSILVPFLRDDPTPLLHALASNSGPHLTKFEIILLDDGSHDALLSAHLIGEVQALPIAASLITLTENAGRAAGRNLLARQARGEYLLFLDADMLPDSPDFLSDWLAVVQNDEPAVSFGGFSVEQASTEARFAVHRAMASRSDCLNATQRALQPEKYVFTSNLLVRADVFAANRFDENFVGWGWEDVEWALRVSAEHAIRHHEIPATHLGLDTVHQLMEKYRQSAPNFARVAAQHPELVADYPSYRVAKALKALYLQNLVARIAEQAAQNEKMPVAMRAMALRFYRAALYAEALKRA